MHPFTLVHPHLLAFTPKNPLEIFTESIIPYERDSVLLKMSKVVFFFFLIGSDPAHLHNLTCLPPRLLSLAQVHLSCPRLERLQKLFN